VHGGQANLVISEEAFYFWMTLATGIYLLVANGLQFSHSGWEAVQKHGISRVYDALTFSTSIILILGLMIPGLLTALGSVKPFLFLAGVTGFVYAVMACAPKKP
jgi:hypothetical protein